MPIEFACQNGHALTMPEDYIGAMAECPLCGDRLRIPAVSRGLPAVPLQEDISPSLPRPRLHSQDVETAGLDGLGRPVTSGEEKLALRTVRIGISFHRAKVLVFILGLIFCIIATGLMALINFQPVLDKQIQRDLQRQQRRPMPRWGARPANGWQVQQGNQNAGPFAGLDPDLQDEAHDALVTSQKQSELLFWGWGGLTALLGLIGSWYLLSVPRSSHAGGIIFFSLVMDLVHMAAAVVNDSLFRGQHWILAFVGLSSMALAYVTFMMFLHRFAQFLGETEVARHAAHHLKLWSRLLSSTVLCFFGGLYLMFVNPIVGAMVLVGGLILLLIFWLMWIFSYLRLLRDMRVALDQHLAA